MKDAANKTYNSTRQRNQADMALVESSRKISLLIHGDKVALVIIVHNALAARATGLLKIRRVVPRHFEPVPVLGAGAVAGRRHHKLLGRKMGRGAAWEDLMMMEPGPREVTMMVMRAARW